MRLDAASPACNPGFLDTMTWDEPRAARLGGQAIRDGRFAQLAAAGLRFQAFGEECLLTAAEIGAQLGVTAQYVDVWRRHGLLPAVPYNDRDEYLYKPAGKYGPRKQQGKKLSERRRCPEFCSQAANEVHHEA